jgi:hypothetical protein
MLMDDAGNLRHCPNVFIIIQTEAFAAFFYGGAFHDNKAYTAPG